MLASLCLLVTGFLALLTLHCLRLNWERDNTFMVAFGVVTLIVQLTGFALLVLLWALALMGRLA